MRGDDFFELFQVNKRKVMIPPFIQDKKSKALRPYVASKPIKIDFTWVLGYFLTSSLQTIAKNLAHYGFAATFLIIKGRKEKSGNTV